MLKLSLSGVLLVLLMVPLAQAAAPVKKATKSRAVAPVFAVVEAEPAELSPEHLAVAQRVAVGTVPCELGAQVKISAHQTWAGRFVLEHGRQKYQMAPVPTSTGAVRLEDAAGGAVWLQLANKSMLMDQKLGRRLADECMNAGQAVVAEALLRTPAPSLLEPLNNTPAVAAAESKPEAVAAATK
ncbi:hypothetical protein [Rhodoferax saidenbachensis]|uniref:Uncharacterized protein n=1 Tax=Rhodoferax saidenbachensis TaxID=1484693 RepID=A0ABU1ZLP9_9BURK|nr:hypothetical protein [Rhodoferax saidenbachensis]MDR7306469.1 hypothetical protein [Rhodoferax saidenbachensis]